jgi:uncharacterized protein YggT (Ycf19 family)
MKHVLTFLALMVFQYLLVAFINWNMNAGEWAQGARAFYAFVSPFLSVASMLVIEIIKEK